MSLLELVFAKAEVNAPKLHEDLKVALGEAFIGVSTGEGQVRVHVQASMSQAQQDQAASIVAAHDPLQLTAAQQAEVDRQALLESLRKPWAEWTASDREKFLHVLAERAGIIPLG